MACSFLASDARSGEVWWGQTLQQPDRPKAPGLIPVPHPGAHHHSRAHHHVGVIVTPHSGSVASVVAALHALHPFPLFLGQNGVHPLLRVGPGIEDLTLDVGGFSVRLVERGGVRTGGIHVLQLSFFLEKLPHQGGFFFGEIVANPVDLFSLLLRQVGSPGIGTSISIAPHHPRAHAIATHHSGTHAKAAHHPGSRTITTHHSRAHHPGSHHHAAPIALARVIALLRKSRRGRKRKHGQSCQHDLFHAVSPSVIQTTRNAHASTGT